jgi:hypothetical protein
MVIGCGDDTTTVDAALADAAITDAAIASDAAQPDASDDATPVPSPCGVPMATRTFELGIAFALHPDRLGDGDLLTEFIGDIPSYGELFGVQSGWDVNPDGDGNPIVVALAYAWTDGTPVVVYAGISAEFQAVPANELDTYWQTNAAAFQAVAVDIAQRYQPRHMSLGVESNRWHVASPTAFTHLVDVHRATYDAIKAVEPTVQVGAGVQLDYMRADAELTGLTLTEHFDVLPMFAGKVDFLAVSAYPWLGMDSPAEIPDTYLSDLTDQLDVPLLVTETGWPSESAFVATATEQAQVDYVCRLLAVAEDVELTGVIYGLPFDDDFGAVFGTPVFDRLGLANEDGSVKLVRGLWDELRAIPLAP